MDKAEFSEAGKKLIDWIINYKDNIKKHGPMSETQPGEMAAALPSKNLFANRVTVLERLLTSFSSHRHRPPKAGKVRCHLRRVPEANNEICNTLEPPPVPRLLSRRRCFLQHYCRFIKCGNRFELFLVGKFQLIYNNYDIFVL